MATYYRLPLLAYVANNHHRKEIQRNIQDVAWQLNALGMHHKVRCSEHRNVDYKTAWQNKLCCHKDPVWLWILQRINQLGSHETVEHISFECHSNEIVAWLF